MTLLERFFGFFGSRADAGPLALPGPTTDPGLGGSGGARLDSVVNGFTGLGGAGDKGAVGRPNKFVVPLDDEELRGLYTNNGLARKIVDFFPTRATRKGWTVPEIGEEDKRLRTWDRVTDALRWARLHGGSAMLIVTDDYVPPAFRRRPDLWLQQPLDLARVQRVVALQVFDAFEAVPMERDRDVRSPTFRLPRLWSVSTDGFSGYVHSSRIVHFRGARRPPSDLSAGGFMRTNRMPDDSCLQAIWDEVRRLTETMQGGATLAQELRESVLKVNDLPALMTADDAGVFERRMSTMGRMKSLLGMILLGPGDEYTNRSNPPTGFDQLSNAAKSMLAAVAEIPEIELYGSTPGGLGGAAAGDSGHESTRQAISDYQERHRPEIERIYGVIYAAKEGPTKGKAPDGWALDFHPLDEPGEEAKAKVRQIVAQTDVAYVNAGVLLPEDVRTGRFGPDGWTLELADLPQIEAPDEDEIERVRAEMEAGMGGEGGEGGEPEDGDDLVEDSADGCCVLIPAADPGLLAAVERAIGQTLVVKGDPHVTVLYVGKGLDEVAVVEVGLGVAEAVRDLEAVVVERGVLRAFPAGPHGTPIVVEFEPWALERLNGSLLRRLAHVVVARQHRRFRPHLCIGYAPGPLSPEALAALLALDVSAVRVPVAELHVMVGGVLVASVPVGS